MEWVRGLGATLLAGVAVSACGNPTGAESCPDVMMNRTAGIGLDLSAPGDLGTQEALLQAEVAASLDAIRPVMDVTDLRISLVADPGRVIPETGLGGFNPGPHEVRIVADSADPDLQAVLAAELSPTPAHEIHHAMRRRTVGYGSTFL